MISGWGGTTGSQGPCDRWKDGNDQQMGWHDLQQGAMSPVGGAGMTNEKGPTSSSRVGTSGGLSGMSGAQSGTTSSFRGVPGSHYC